MNICTGLVIVNYNRGKLVREMAQFFSKYNSIDNVVVVDNCSSDNSREELMLMDNKKIKLILSSRNVGYAKGNNLGLTYLHDEKKCDYCFIVNPDVFFEEKVIIEILNAFEYNPDYGIITSARIDPLATIPQIQYTIRIYDTFWLQFLSYFNFARHYYLLKRYGVYHFISSENHIKQIAIAPGSFFGIRMNSFPDSKILDEGTFLYGEEELLAMKCRVLGIKEGFVSSVVYEHRHILHSTTLNNKSILPVKYMLTSKRYFQKKYLHLNMVERWLLLLAEKISLAERYMIMVFK